MSHYYDEDPSVISNEQRIQYQLNHHKIDLITDNGVFSKDKVDYGSDVLVQTFLKAHPPGPSRANCRCWLWLRTNWFDDC